MNQCEAVGAIIAAAGLISILDQDMSAYLFVGVTLIATVCVSLVAYLPDDRRINRPRRDIRDQETENRSN